MNLKDWNSFFTIMTIGLLMQTLSLNAVSSDIIKVKAGSMKIGWATADVTPDRPVGIAGGSSARISEGIRDRVLATTLVIESVRTDGSSDMAIMVSMDAVAITELLNQKVKKLVKKSISAIDTVKIILSATHTHSAPEQFTEPGLSIMHKKYDINVPVAWAFWGVDLGVMTADEYIEFSAARIAKAIEQAWNSRKPGGISFGLAYASTGQNRLTTYYDGTAAMYGSANRPDFSHMEGYEDHSLGLLYTWDTKGKLTGVVINIGMTSQIVYGFMISSDFWHETRNELHNRLGKGLFVLPLCSAAGDQSPKIMIDERAEKRMEKLTGRNQMEQIANRIADGVTSILNVMEKNIEWNPEFKHQVEMVELNRRVITEKDLTTRRSTFHNKTEENVYETFDRLLAEYKKMYREIEEHPEMKQKNRWYTPITSVHWLLGRAWSTMERYELQKKVFTVPAEVHVIRIGDMAIATNPFELYVDYGMQIKARSKAVQTFVVQLASPGYLGYLPTERAVKGGAYGAIPQSTTIGPEGGRVLVNRTVDLINSFWQ
jgi:hypothetical protein